MGRIEKYQGLLDLVSTGTKVEWAKMGTVEDGFCYDEIKLGTDAPFKIQAGEQVSAAPSHPTTPLKPSAPKPHNVCA